MHQIKKTKEARAEHAESYQRFAKERTETVALLRERLATLVRNKGRTAEDFFQEFFLEHKIGDDEYSKD